MILKSQLNMNRPVWVWCYIIAEVHEDREGMAPLSAWGQAHTYAFTSEEEAKLHPARMGWKKHHGYQLQKVYLNGEFAP